MAPSSVGDRSQMAAISNASGRRPSSGRCTAWATAPSPATPIRRGRRGTRPEGDWAIVAEYTGEPMDDGEARPTTRPDRGRPALTVASGLPQTRRHVHRLPTRALARPPRERVVARGD